MASLRGRILLPLLGLAILTAAANSKSFRGYRSYVSVAGGGDSLASGTGALVGYGRVDFGRAGLAGVDVLPGGVDSDGDFDTAIEVVSGRRGKNGKSAESAFLLSKKGTDDLLLERGSFSLDDGQLKSRRLKDLIYKESDAGAAVAQQASYSRGGERIKANDTTGFSNSYHLDESGKKSTFRDKYRKSTKFNEAGDENSQSSSDTGRKSAVEKIQTALKAGDVKRNGAYSKGKQRESADEYVSRVGLNKFLKEKGERRKGRKRYLRKGDEADVGDFNDDEEFYDDGDEDDDELDVDTYRHYDYKN